MHVKSAILFKVLLNRFLPGSKESFLHRLSKEEAEEVLQHKISTDNTACAVTWKQDILFNTHYSWLSLAVQQTPHFLQASTIAAFPEPQRSRLQSLFKIKVVPKDLSPSMKAFLLDKLFHQWNPKNVIPKEYLPESSLSFLLELSKSQLVDLIDMLSMHDLADALRYIVDKKNLKLIYQHLPQKHQQFLRLCLHQKEKISTQKLEIDKWNGDPKKLETLLHVRGMFRLGKAICGQDPQFVWHLTHILDTGRGTALAKYYRQEAIPHVTPYLIQQLQSAMNFLKKKSVT